MPINLWKCFLLSWSAYLRVEGRIPSMASVLKEENWGTNVLLLNLFVHVHFDNVNLWREASSYVINFLPRHGSPFFFRQIHWHNLYVYLPWQGIKRLLTGSLDAARCTQTNQQEFVSDFYLVLKKTAETFLRHRVNKYAQTCVWSQCTCFGLVWLSQQMVGEVRTSCGMQLVCYAHRPRSGEKKKTFAEDVTAAS